MTRHGSSPCSSPTPPERIPDGDRNDRPRPDGCQHDHPAPGRRPPRGGVRPECRRRGRRGEGRGRGRRVAGRARRGPQAAARRVGDGPLGRSHRVHRARAGRRSSPKATPSSTAATATTRIRCAAASCSRQRASSSWTPAPAAASGGSRRDTVSWSAATKAAVDRLRPIFETLAPAADRGWGHVGPGGSGHFVKMVHNGIEYGLMQAYAEGFAILRTRRRIRARRVADRRDLARRQRGALVAARSHRRAP